MKITAVTSYPVKVGFRNQFIVKIDTDEGVSGIGEGGMSGRELGMAGMVEHLARWLVGEDPGRIEHLWQTCYRSAYFEGGNILTAALSAIDIALWDIQGKRLGVPVYDLLGGACRDRLPCFATPGALEPGIVETARSMFAEGWRVQRFVPGMPADPNDPGRPEEVYEPLEAIDNAVHWLREIRSELGDEVKLAIDFHHRLSTAETAHFCQRVADLHLYFLEEPMRSENPRAYRQLREMTGVPFAIGEEFASPFAFVPWIEDGITNFARVDVSNVGGISAARKVAALAELHYIDMMPHNPLGPVTTAASIHYGLATANFAYLEYQHAVARHCDPELFPETIEIEGASFPKPTASGLGVTFNHELAAERAFEFWDAPRWRRRDGSYQNW